MNLYISCYSLTPLAGSWLGRCRQTCEVAVGSEAQITVRIAKKRTR